jgi:IS5 family transposase
MYKTSATQLSFVEALLYKQLPEDKLSQINNMIDWQPFEKILSKLHPSKEGRPAYNPLQMFKILIIQQMYKHSDPEMEKMLYVNNSYRRFVGLTGTERVPDYSTICRFRMALEGMELMQELFNELLRQLKDRGYELKDGRIIDSRVVKAARNPKKGDPDAGFTKKQGKSSYGYKDHIAVEVENEFVVAYECTPANVHDSQVVEELIEGEEEVVYADKAYCSEAISRKLEERGIRNGIMEKGRRNKPLSEESKQRNKVISRIRHKVERVFGIMSLHLNRRVARYVGLLANRVHLFLTVFAYNLVKLKNYEMKRSRMVVG